MTQSLWRLAWQAIALLGRFSQIVLIPILTIFALGLARNLLRVSIFGGLVFIAACLWIAVSWRASLSYPRAWAIPGSLLCFWLASVPCWLPRLLGTHLEREWARAMDTMQQIRQAESTFYALNHQYAVLTEIQLPNLDVRDDHHALTPSYDLELTLTAATYHLIAKPRARDSAYSCLIGCPTNKSLYAAPAGPIHIDCHCRVATAQSPLATLTPQ